MIQESFERVLRLQLKPIEPLKACCNQMLYDYNIPFNVYLVCWVVCCVL